MKFQCLCRDGYLDSIRERFDLDINNLIAAQTPSKLATTVEKSKIQVERKNPCLRFIRHLPVEETSNNNKKIFECFVSQCFFASIQKLAIQRQKLEREERS